jgi:hypothetical protein
MSEANDLPPVTGAERAMAWLGILAAAGILFVCIDLAMGGRITGAIGQAVNESAPVGGCSDC